MKVFVAGVATETNTFSPIPTAVADFHIARNLGDAASVSCGGVDEIARRCEANGDEFVHGLLAFAEPAGITVRPAYESLRDEILEQLRQTPDVDIVMLLLHGAMVADGYDDCEADLTARCREIVGDDVVIGVELDLHGHIDQRLIDAATIVKSYKEYPHVDIGAVAAELYDACRRTALGEIKPTSALVDCKMVGLYSTFSEPVSSFVQELKAAEAEDGVIAVSFNHGFPWGDVPHMGGKMLVVTDSDQAKAQAIAEKFAAEIYRIRDAAKLDSLPLEQAMPKAAASTQRPTVVADQSDNAGGGAPSDSTFALRWLLDNKVSNAGIAFFYDPEVVKTAIASGEGASLQLRIGGKTSVASGNPVDLRVKVLGIRRDYMHDFPQQDGSAVMTPSGDTVALVTEGCDAHIGGIYLIVNCSRTQCFSPTAFFDFGITDLDIYIPKSTNHYMSGFGPIAGEVIRMAAPGAVVPIMTEIEYQRFSTEGVWPWHNQ